jgi:hypothetical protein
MCPFQWKGSFDSSLITAALACVVKLLICASATHTTDTNAAVIDHQSNPPSFADLNR